MTDNAQFGNHAPPAVPLCLCARSSYILLFLCAALHAPLHAQTADRIQTLLQTKAVSYGQAARFVLEAADVTGFDSTSEQDAARFAAEQNWLPANINAQDSISLDNLSLLIMKAFGLKGGLMYKLFGNAHYSYRELVYKDLIQGQSDPKMKVPGEKMLFIVNRLLYMTADNPWDFTDDQA